MDFMVAKEREGGVWKKSWLPRLHQMPMAARQRIKAMMVSRRLERLKGSSTKEVDGDRIPTPKTRKRNISTWRSKKGGRGKSLRRDDTG